MLLGYSVAMDRRVKLLQEILSGDLQETGAKAAGLARLASLGLPVPAAFAVAASLFEEVRSRLPDEPEIEALAAAVPPQAREAIDAALDSLGAAPHGYAVRSSAPDEDAAGASFAGVHDSFLRLRRDEVPAALFRCWASSFSERALSYRRRMGLPCDISAVRMGAVVQVMLSPSAAGVLFTREPGSAADTLLLQAVRGSGEGLHRGAVPPVSIRLPRRPGEERGGAPPESPLPERLLPELAAMALKAEAAWGVPLDLEWAVDGGRLFLLQARPITATKIRSASPALAATDGAPAPDPLWTRANLGELLPELPSVFFVSLMEGIDWRAWVRRSGIEAPEGEILRVIEGRPYLNLSLAGPLPARFDSPRARFARAMEHGGEPEAAPGAPDGPIRAFPGHPASPLRLLLRQRRVPREARTFFDRVHARLRRLGEAEREISDRRMADLLREMRDFNEEFLCLLLAGFGRASSKMLAVELLFPPGGGADRFVNAVAGAGRRNVFVRQGLDLLRLANLAREEGRVVQFLLEARNDYREFRKELEGTRFLRAFEDYLDRYGHRGFQETDPSMPVYAQDPRPLLRSIGAAAGDPLLPEPGAMERRQRAAAGEAWRGLWRGLPGLERLVPIRILLLRAAVAALRNAMALRERIRFEGMRVNAAYRLLLREAGERLLRRGLLESPGDLFLLRLEEIEALFSGRDDGATLRRTARGRRQEREGQERIPMPDLLRESEIPRLREREPIRPGEGGSFQGLPVGPGRAEGRAVILEGPHQADRIRRGDILVAATLDPSWIPLFPLASGLVVEMGGILSHGSIITREYGLPAVANLPGITRKLKNGERIVVDGSAGTVRRLAG